MGRDPLPSDRRQASSPWCGIARRLLPERDDYPEPVQGGRGTSRRSLQPGDAPADRRRRTGVPSWARPASARRPFAFGEAGRAPRGLRSLGPWRAGWATERHRRRGLVALARGRGGEPPRGPRDRRRRVRGHRDPQPPGVEVRRVRERGCAQPRLPLLRPPGAGVPGPRRLGPAAGPSTSLPGAARRRPTGARPRHVP